MKLLVVMMTQRLLTRMDGVLQGKRPLSAALQKRHSGEARHLIFHWHVSRFICPSETTSRRVAPHVPVENTHKVKAAIPIIRDPTRPDQTTPDKNRIESPPPTCLYVPCSLFQLHTFLTSSTLLLSRTHPPYLLLLSFPPPSLCSIPVTE